MKKKYLSDEIGYYFSKKSELVKTILIDERNQFIANKIQTSLKDNLLVILPNTKISEIKNLLNNDFKYDPSIEQLPEPGKFKKLIPIIIAFAVMAIIIIGFFRGKDIALSMIGAWVLANGLFTSIAALLVLAHPFTILGAWVVSPLTSINPAVGAGLILAIIEAFFRKPRVIDIEDLAIDLRSFKGAFRNHIIRIFLVFIATSLGSTVGTFFGLSWIAKLLN
ncbi:hypothetical protein ACFL2K_00210 [Candidatus Margulisiibacteriota bacterium]